MTRFLKTALAGIVACGAVAALSFNVGCMGSKPVDPKVAAEQAAAKEKLNKAETAYKGAGKTADGMLAKKPKDFDGAIKAYADIKATVAGTPFEKKSQSAIDDLNKDKAKAAEETKAAAAKAAEKEKLTKAEAAFKTAETAWEKNPKDFDGALKLLDAAKPIVAGTSYEKKTAALVATVTAAKTKSADAAKGDAAKAAEKEKLVKAEAAFRTASDAWTKNPKDFDGALKLLDAAKPAVAGTAFEKKTAELVAEVTKAKTKAADDAKANVEKDKLAKAEAAFKAADKAWDKNPKDFDGALKLLDAAKPLVAGTVYEKKTAELLAEVTKAKTKAADDAKNMSEKDKLAKAENAFNAAEKAYKKSDFDGSLKLLTDAKPVVAGTAFEAKCVALTATVEKAKADAAKAEAAKPVVKPITELLAAKPAEEVKTAEEAWKKAGEAEKVVGKAERDRLAAALPYYLVVVKSVDAEGKYDINSAAAALRVAQIVEKYADFPAENLTAAKFYMVAANMNLGSDAWEDAEKPFVKAGKGFEYAQMLQGLSKNAAERAKELGASADADDKAQSAKLQKFSVSVGKKGDALAAKYAPKP